MAQEGLAAAGSQQFTIGRVVGTSFSVLMRNIVAFGIIAVLIGIPLMLVTILASPVPGETVSKFLGGDLSA